MFGSILSAAVRTLGSGGMSAARFVNQRMLAGRKPGYDQWAGGTVAGDESAIAMKFMAGTARDAGKALLFLGQMGAAGAGTTKALESLANTIVQRREDLSLFHGGIAAGFARMERQQLGLSLRRAQGTAAGVMRMQDAVMQMREDTLQGRMLMENLWNSVGTGMATIVSFIARTAEPTFKQLSDWLVSIGAISPPDAQQRRMQGDLLDFFEKMQRGQFGKPINQRPGKDGRL